ncbi:MAG: methyltransferase domain-containing protein [Nitrolancea sp.]
MDDDIQTTWNRLAANYDAHGTDLNMVLADNTLKRTLLKPGMRLLDVAAGSGALSIPAARRGACVTATDFSREMANLLRQRARSEGLGAIDTFVGDGHALAVKDDSFDISASQFGVMLFADPRRGVQEMVRVTKPGGQILIVVFGSRTDADTAHFVQACLRSAFPGFRAAQYGGGAHRAGFGDAEVLRRTLVDVGLAGVRVETLHQRRIYRSSDDVWNLMTSNVAGDKLITGLTTEQRVDLKRTMEEEFLMVTRGSGPATFVNLVNVGIGVKNLR